VTVRVGTAQGDRVASARIDAREDSITVDSVMSAPTMVIFDGGNTVLKKLTFEQPTAQLARQLEQDPDLWNRQWVIDQLAARPGDRAAGAALATAALKADYYLTRAEAAAALDSFPAAVALKPLRAALKDTSSAVRGAALGALAGVKGARKDVIKLATAAWKSDPSYQVRAAALEALIVADSAHRAEHIRTCLRTASYQDEIQNSALSAMVRYPNAVPATENEPLLGQQQLPAFLLAALARRGDSTAMGILVRHVDDDRGWVREWVLNAFRNAMPRQVAARALQPVVGNLKHEDAKKAVSELLKQQS
jgi:HEAT repeat protein